MSATSAYYIVGPPGTGKTTTLARQVEHDVARYGSDAVLITSLTKAAAAEVRGRRLPLPDAQVGTLHAHCYRALGRPELAEAHLDEWNEYAPLYALRGDGRADLDDSAAGAGAGAGWADDPYGDHGETDGDRLLAQYRLLRARLTPRALWPLEVAAFADRWDAWKHATDLLDFADLIDVAYETLPEAPGGPRFLYVDEGQDHDSAELRLLHAWGARAERLYLIADPDQCQPPGTRVLVADGDGQASDASAIAIEDLDPTVHRLVSYDGHSGLLCGFRKPYGFKKAARPYQGRLLTVRTGDAETRCTPDHHWLVRWQTKATQWNAVYIMRRGGRWRVGWCQVFNSEGTFHLGQRARNERADAAWILEVFDNRTDASVYESVISATYGLPTVTFEPVHGAKHLTATAIDRVFAALDPDAQAERAMRCLLAHGRHPHHPIWWRQDQQNQKRGLTRASVVRGYNLLPGIMALPVRSEGRSVQWAPFSVHSAPYEGVVYSLQVEPHHYYVADGIVTHNCVYQWRGADPHVFRAPVPPEQRKVLSQSHRVPRAVHALAMRWIAQIPDRDPVEYRPRDADGEVRRLPEATWRYPEPLLAAIEEELAAARSVMVLATCGYQLKPLLALLRREGVPFHNPYRRRQGAWNPLTPGRGVGMGDRLLALLRLQRDVWGEEARIWTPQDLKAWVEIVRAEVLRRGAKAAIARAGGMAPCTEDELLEWFDVETLTAILDAPLDWIEGAVMGSKAKGLEFPLTVARRRGAAVLREEPRLCVGTMHSVKGGEAQTVFLFPDLSYAGALDWESGGERRAGLVRLFYVAATRASETLVPCGAASPHAVEI